jgi:hypothetical protein
LKRANLRRKWSAISKAALSAFHNQPSRFTARRLFVSSAAAYQLVAGGVEVIHGMRYATPRARCQLVEW